MLTLRNVTLAIALASFGLAGCSSDTTADNSTDPTTTSSTGTSTGGGAVNGCDAAGAEDHTGDATTTVGFGAEIGFVYSPSCLKISAGSAVSFEGDLLAHPLRGGADEVVDATSPIPPTDDGTSVKVTFPNAGTYGFFCNIHGSIGMQGAVVVE